MYCTVTIKRDEPWLLGYIRSMKRAVSNPSGFWRYLLVVLGVTVRDTDGKRTPTSTRGRAERRSLLYVQGKYLKLKLIQAAMSPSLHPLFSRRATWTQGQAVKHTAWKRGLESLETGEWRSEKSESVGRRWSRRRNGGEFVWRVEKSLSPIFYRVFGSFFSAYLHPTSLLCKVIGLLRLLLPNSCLFSSPTAFKCLQSPVSRPPRLHTHSASTSTRSHEAPLSIDVKASPLQSPAHSDVHVHIRPQNK